MDIISKEHSKKMQSGHMLGETNNDEFFTLPESPKKSDVNRHVRDSEDNKTTLSRCKHSSTMKEVME
jgi:hypothetical protein